MTISSDRDPLVGRFQEWRDRGRSALIPYLTAGYPAPTATLGLLEEVAGAGADIIELGVPFSDPVADGPTIQRSSQRALEQGMTLSGVLDLLAAFRRYHATPVVLFSYLNPILAYGLESFLLDAAKAGAEGILITDLPVGSDERLERRFLDSPLALIRLVAPTTDPGRARAIASAAQGFLYYISRTGVTGARDSLRDTLAGEVAELRAASPVPIAVGFGISTPRQAAQVAGVADGVVVGSALIDALDREGSAGAARLIASFRAAMDAGGGDRRRTG